MNILLSMRIDQVVLLLNNSSTSVGSRYVDKSLVALRTFRSLKLLVCLVSHNRMTLDSRYRFAEHNLRINDLGDSRSLTRQHWWKRNILRDLQVSVKNTL